ncbi:hypothetical protein PQU92_11835 [Asticcacaulis sp. BYS171W]|uniref:Glycerophosphoryl diester phosphodiesterase membrane domain-containing protein n=1 Tax=Asticcacaulis aquaticus TaxID=2984212 RepID=A0ABT5HV67_9CAUL|nr:hypothetical protein [Asticcacaulis aquaticus]MDC7683970.1 hypothetical protein [Asticcacaulis aquaticus]
MKLSIDFAFAGIEIIKKNPLAVLIWGAVALVVSVVTNVVTIVLAGSALSTLKGYEQSPPSDPMAVFGAIGDMAPAIILSVIIGLTVAAVIQCAVFRSQLEPEARGFAYLQLGAAEIRQILATILWTLAFFVFYLLFALAVGIVIGLLSLVTKISGILGGLLIFVAGVGAFVAFFYVLCRWSLVMVQTYAEGKINIFGSFKLTEGNGWTLLGGYLLLVLATIILMIIVYGVMFGITMGAGGDFMSSIQQMSQPDVTSLSALLTPGFVIQLVVGGLLSGVFYALIHGAAVSAYQTLARKKTNLDIF